MVKVLLSGDVGGEWKALHARVEKLHGSAHGPFDFVLCAGECDIASSDSVSSWPLPVYVMARSGNVVSTSKNLHFISQNSIQTLAGLKVSFLANASGIEDFRGALEKESIDILLTHDYPQGFEHLVSPEQVPSSIQRMGLKSVAEAAQAALPRYHVAGTHGVFYQRLPYVTTQGIGRRVTRFIGLGHVSASAEKDKKWMHALNLDVWSSTASPADIPPGTTQNPFEASKRELHEASSRKRPNAAGLSAEKAQELMQQHGGKKGRHSFYDTNSEYARLPNRQECWFCLSTPTVEMHLIVSIGNEAYLAIPKGPIVPDHALIIPIQHTASMQNIGKAAWAEVNQFKAALRRFYARQGKAMIVMDRNVATMGAAHGHLQVIPVPMSLLSSVANVFHDEGKKYNVDFRTLAPDEEVVESEYLLVEFPSNDGEDDAHTTRLLHAVKGKHYMQFGRDVAATLLNAPRRGNWKYCVVPKEEEEKMTQAFKTDFAPFDFTLALE
ncbi:Aste57867_19451 [Aphanomyces stellatus]|uniref:Aste57867_19451 protein n=1 Tax=Aphanomyces stellatus TaxID=120398 RepID=A0A485LD81_9STRA|nr:hypothetical protein As57867_019387 [Aphanomyces stellatus]VFT96164.1 Aste57867_19451 [Aphanomyces stellatus]